MSTRPCASRPPGRPPDSAPSRCGRSTKSCARMAGIVLPVGSKDPTPRTIDPRPRTVDPAPLNGFAPQDTRCDDERRISKGRTLMKLTSALAGALVVALAGTGHAAGQSVLFVGNSFTFGSGS